MTKDDMRGMLIVTAFWAADRPVGRIISVRDVTDEPGPAVVTSDVERLLSYVETWWTDQLRSRPG